MKATYQAPTTELLHFTVQSILQTASPITNVNSGDDNIGYEGEDDGDGIAYGRHRNNAWEDEEEE